MDLKEQIKSMSKDIENIIKASVFNPYKVKYLQTRLQEMKNDLNKQINRLRRKRLGLYVVENKEET
jgi:hypothetical protein